MKNALSPHCAATCPPRRAARLAVVALLSTLLAACGFQLRGNYHVPAFLTAVDLKLPAGSQPLATELRLALERKHIAASGGDMELEVVSDELNRQAASVDSRARAAEYILVYTVGFRFNSSDGRRTGPLETLILRRSYQYSDVNVVGKNTEEETLLRELRADAAQQIVRQLAALEALPGAADADAGDRAAAASMPAGAPAPAQPAGAPQP
ncbi:MAG: LPS assembly lipoprotein LptE [Pseudomonadota bacterium]